MVLMPGFQSTRLATEGALEPFFFLYTDDSIQGNPETCKQSSITLNYEVKNNLRVMRLRKIWAEGTFAVLKREHKLNKIQKRGLQKAIEECLLSATALNLKRLVKAV